MNDLEQGFEEDLDEDFDQDPGFQQALELVMKGLYEAGAAREIAESLKMAPSIADGMADSAYSIIEIAGQGAEDGVPEDLIVLLAVKTLSEIGEIAEAAGLPVQGSDIGMALQKMIIRFLQESGYDASQLQEAMAQIDPSAFNQEVK